MPFTPSCEFEENDTSVLEGRIYDKDDTCLQESCKEEVKPCSLEFNDVARLVECESFLCGFGINEVVDVVSMLNVIIFF